MASEAQQAALFVKYKIKQLTEGNRESATKATLAQLRRGIGRKPGSMPELWEVTFNGLPETLTRKAGEPTFGEWAVHTALTFFALHQQGKDLLDKCMDKEGAALGLSLRKLIKSDDEEKRIKRRFDAAATSDSLEEFSYHLRGLIKLLKTENIPLDYPGLTQDLYLFQFPEARASIRLRWGRDFYLISSAEKTENEDLSREDGEKSENE